LRNIEGDLEKDYGQATGHHKFNNKLSKCSRESMRLEYNPSQAQNVPLNSDRDVIDIVKTDVP
jgi:hypothetical protein